MIEVSVVICALNEERRIGRQLRALDAQRDAPPFEVIMVDNGSTDRTAEVVRAWIDGGDRVAASARLVDASSTPGIPAARNAGARAAAGRILAFCDADDEVQPGWVAAFAREIDGEALAGGRIIAVDPSGAEQGDLYGEQLTPTPYLPYAGGANLAVSRSLFEEVGGFDESLPRYGFEDVDFSWRVQEAGHPLLFVPSAVVRFSLSDTRASIRKRFTLGQGRVLMARRFPRYDSTRHTVRSTTADVGRTAGRLLRDLVLRRTLDRSLAATLVAATGRVVGAVRYRGAQGGPARKLLDGRQR